MRARCINNTIKNKEDVINFLSVYKYFNINRKMKFSIRQLFIYVFISLECVCTPHTQREG